MRGLEEKAKYQIFIRTINKIDDKKVFDSGLKDVPFPTSPAAVTTFTVTGGDGSVMVNATALTEDFRTKASDSSQLESNDIEYWFYYMKTGVIIDDMTVSENATASDIVNLINRVIRADNVGDLNLRRIKLVAGFDGGLGTDKKVSLVPTQYYYVVRVQETAASTNGINTARSTVTVEESKAVTVELVSISIICSKKQDRIYYSEY